MWPTMMNFPGGQPEESTTSEDEVAPASAPASAPPPARAALPAEPTKTEISRANTFMRNLPRQTLAGVVQDLEDSLEFR